MWNSTSSRQQKTGHDWNALYLTGGYNGYKSGNWYISTGYFVVNDSGASEALSGIRYMAKMETEYPSALLSIDFELFLFCFS